MLKSSDGIVTRTVTHRFAFDYCVETVEVICEIHAYVRAPEKIVSQPKPVMRSRSIPEVQ